MKSKKELEDKIQDLKNKIKFRHKLDLPTMVDIDKFFEISKN